EELAGAARLEAFGGQSLENLGKREPDGGAVFDGRNLDGRVRRSAGSRGGLGLCGVQRAVKARVEVAIWFVAQGGRLALAAIGLDVTALHVAHVGVSFRF